MEGISFVFPPSITKFLCTRDAQLQDVKYVHGELGMRIAILSLQPVTPSKSSSINKINSKTLSWEVFIYKITAHPPKKSEHVP